MSEVKQFILRLGLIILIAFIIIRVFSLTFPKRSTTASTNNNHMNTAGKERLPSSTLSPGATSFTSMTNPTTVLSSSRVNNTNTIPSRSKASTLYSHLNRIKGGSNRTFRGKIYEWDNKLIRTTLSWGDFVALPQQSLRNKAVSPHAFLSTLRLCSDSQHSCTNEWNDRYLDQWKSRSVKDLCEAHGQSKISCFDSPSSPKSRLCIFENAMLDFQKMRRRRGEGGQWTRSWEKGFLSASCGEMAPEDIGYLGLYKADIVGGDEARCDYIFNETVLLYSHENSRSLFATINDYLNVYISLWLAGVGRYSKDVTLINLDGLKRSRYFNDQPSSFFRLYNASMRRVIPAIELADPPSHVCFKRLLVQPRPVLNMLASTSARPAGSNSGNGNSGFNGMEGSGGNSSTCSDPGTSSLLQRFNIQARMALNLLEESTYLSSTLRILLVTRSTTSRYHKPLDHFIARLIANEDVLVQQLRQEMESLQSTRTALQGIHLIVDTVDLAALSFDEQVREVSRSSIVIGMHSSSLALSVLHQSLGSRWCCGLLEIFPPLRLEGGGSSGNRQGYGSLARAMGVIYKRFDLLATPPNQDCSGQPTSNGSVVVIGSCIDPKLFVGTVKHMVNQLTINNGNTLPGHGGSCVLREVAQRLFL
eukprot:gene755-819_t